MESFLNAGLGIGILMFLLLLFKSDKKLEDYLFLSWIAVMLFQIIFYLITIYHFELKGLSAILSFGMPLLGGPLLFLYILKLTGHSVSQRTILAHLCVYPIFIVVLFVLQAADTIVIVAADGFFDLPSNTNSWTQYYAVPLAISGLLYCIWDLILLRKHKQTIVDLFSYDEKINLKWLNYVVYSYFLLFILASFFIFSAIHFQLFDMADAFSFVGITLSAMLVSFGFYGFRQTSIFSNVNLQQLTNSNSEINTLEQVSYSKSGLTQEKIKALANELAAFMKKEKPFLNEDLNLGLLAEQSQISAPHLSQVINQHFKKNFYDFINQYRVEEAKQMLSASKFDHLSILGIAYDCGFKSKSSFNRYFKKHTRVSPSEFKKKQNK